MGRFETDLKKGDWVRLKALRSAQTGRYPVPQGYIGRVVSLNANHSGRIGVALRFDNRGNPPDYERTGAFVSASPLYCHKLHDLERLAFEAKEILR